MREFTERMKIISHCPVKIFIASYIPRYWYPYRLQHARRARPWLQEESLETIMDSAIGDNSVGNEQVLDKAAELHADYVVPADTLNDQEATTEAVHEFVRLYERHHCTATPLIPLQPPYDDHYQELAGFSHYVLGGIAASDPETQLTEIRRFRDEAGRYVYAHGLGLGASETIIQALRDDPTLLDSFDLSTPEQIIRGDKIADSSWKQVPFEYPRGENSSTVRSQYAQAFALQLNYMLGPFWDADQEDAAQTTIWDSFARADGGTTDIEDTGKEPSNPTPDAGGRT